MHNEFACAAVASLGDDGTCFSNWSRLQVFLCIVRDFCMFDIE